MRIATFNVNSVNARLPVLLRWLAETRPDVACLQELKAAQEKFPLDAIRGAGYHAIWHTQTRPFAGGPSSPSGQQSRPSLASRFG